MIKEINSTKGGAEDDDDDENTVNIIQLFY